jgi:hypothetical protein
MAKVNFSLSSFKIGDPAVDGGMGTVLSEIGINKVVRNTTVLTMAEGTTTNFDLEIEDNPVASVDTPGLTTLASDLYATDGSQLATLFGGTYTPAGTGPESWEMPTSAVELEKSVELTHKNGAKVQIPRMKLVARFEWNFKRDSLVIVHIIGTVLKPTKALIGAIKYIGAPVA